MSSSPRPPVRRPPVRIPYAQDGDVRIPYQPARRLLRPEDNAQQFQKPGPEFIMGTNNNYTYDDKLLPHDLESEIDFAGGIKEDAARYDAREQEYEYDARSKAQLEVVKILRDNQLQDDKAFEILGSRTPQKQTTIFDAITKFLGVRGINVNLYAKTIGVTDATRLFWKDPRFHDDARTIEMFNKIFARLSCTENNAIFEGLFEIIATNQSMAPQIASQILESAAKLRPTKSMFGTTSPNPICSSIPAPLMEGGGKRKRKTNKRSTNKTMKNRRKRRMRKTEKTEKTGKQSKQSKRSKHTQRKRFRR